jgi:hypothetical protein
MRIPNTISLIPLALALSGCMVVPVVDNDEAASTSCKTYTRSMSLKMIDWQPSCNNEECLATVLVIGAGSVLVSGSIVLVGNSAHWLEYQGTCSDGFLNATRQLFLESIGNSSPATASY